MKKTKKVFIFLIIIIFMLIIGVNKDRISDIMYSSNFFNKNYHSKYILVLDRESKDIEYKKKHKSKAYPASLTKIMTTIVALENINNISDNVSVDSKTYKNMVDSGASLAGFYGNETVTYRDLLYGTILSSGGEATNSLAVNVGGDVENFVSLMNNKANEIGLKDTNFTNPEGLHNDKQYTTAYDMAKLLDYALTNGDFRAIFTKKTFKTTSTPEHPNGITLKSTVLSKLKGVSQEGFEIIGGKSGTTYKAGECWATLGIKDGREYICVVMGAPIDDIYNPNMLQLRDSIKIFEGIKKWGWNMIEIYCGSYGK